MSCATGFGVGVVESGTGISRTFACPRSIGVLDVDVHIFYGIEDFIVLIRYFCHSCNRILLAHLYHHTTSSSRNLP